MIVHSREQATGSAVAAAAEHARERRAQILHAAMVCFSRRGFHQTTMQDICSEAGVSVGLIYRYFESKEAVISVMAAEHKQHVQALLVQARQAPNLFAALELVFTCTCSKQPGDVQAPFVVDLFAEAGRNPAVATLVRDITESFVQGVADLIRLAPESRSAPPEFPPRAAAELILDTAHGMMMRDVTETGRVTPEEIKDRHMVVLRKLWALIFLTPAAATANH